MVDEYFSLLAVTNVTLHLAGGRVRDWVSTLLCTGWGVVRVDIVLSSLMSAFVACFSHSLHCTPYGLVEALLIS